MSKCTASNYTQPEITVCNKCFHRDICGNRDYLSENSCANLVVGVAPVVRGEWTTKRTHDHDGEPYCSACGEEPYRKSNTDMPNYCPYCGARMSHDETCKGKEATP